MVNYFVNFNAKLTHFEKTFRDFICLTNTPNIKRFLL